MKAYLYEDGAASREAVSGHVPSPKAAYESGVSGKAQDESSKPREAPYTRREEQTEVEAPCTWRVERRTSSTHKACRAENQLHAQGMYIERTGRFPS